MLLQQAAAAAGRRQRRQQQRGTPRPPLACHATAPRRCGLGCWWRAAWPLDTGEGKLPRGFNWQCCSCWRALPTATQRLTCPHPHAPLPLHALLTYVGCRYSWQAYVQRRAAASTPEEAEKRLRNPSPQRRKLLQVLVADEKQHARQQQGQVAQGGGGGAG